MDEPGKKSKNREGRKSIIQVVSSIFQKKSPNSLSPPKSAPASSSSHTSKFSKFKLHKNKDKSKVRILLLNLNLIYSTYLYKAVMYVFYCQIAPRILRTSLKTAPEPYHVSRISFVLFFSLGLKDSAPQAYKVFYC